LFTVDLAGYIFACVDLFVALPISGISPKVADEILRNFWNKKKAMRFWE